MSTRRHLLVIKISSSSIMQQFHFHFQDLSFCDDHFKPDSWEVYSLSDLHMCRNVILRMEVEECLLLPHLLEESVLMTESHLRKVGGREEGEGEEEALGTREGGRGGGRRGRERGREGWLL